MRYLVALMALLTIAVTASADEQIYKWTDASGQIHYGAAPPPERSAERIHVDTDSPAPPPPAEPARETATTAGEAGQKETTATEPASADAAASPEQCKIARRNLEVLERGGAGRRFRKPDGEVVRFSPEELQARIDENRSFLDERCG